MDECHLKRSVGAWAGVWRHSRYQYTAIRPGGQKESVGKWGRVRAAEPLEGTRGDGRCRAFEAPWLAASTALSGLLTIRPLATLVPVFLFKNFATIFFSPLLRACPFVRERALRCVQV